MPSGQLLGEMFWPSNGGPWAGPGDAGEIRYFLNDYKLHHARFIHQIYMIPDGEGVFKYNVDCTAVLFLL